MLGDHDWTTRRESQELRLDVSSVLRHPSFDRAAKFDFDFALLKLSRPVNFALRPDVRPACLPDATEDSLVGTIARASGWGVVDPLAPNRQARKLQVRTKVEHYLNSSFTYFSPRAIGGECGGDAKRKVRESVQAQSDYAQHDVCCDARR